MARSRKTFANNQQLSLLSVLILLIAFMVGWWQNLPTTETQTPTEASQDQTRESIQVSRVIDGDTVELADGRTVRYIGIDTPETKHPNKGVECFGQEASFRNQQLVEGKIVQLEKDVSETDRYGRLLRYVWVGDQLINQVLVEEGFAYAASFPPDIKYQDQLMAAEQQARALNHGLWSSCNVAEVNPPIKKADQPILGTTDQGM